MEDFELPSWKTDLERFLNRTAARVDATLLRMGEVLSRVLRKLADLIDDSSRPHPQAVPRRLRY